MKRRDFVVQFATGAVAIAAAGRPSFAQAKRYLTDEQALRLVLPPGQIYRDVRTLDDRQAAAVEAATRIRLDSRTQTIYRGMNGGFAMIVDEIGKDMPITFVVGVTPQFRVSRVALMVFRESRGWEVENARFTNQFIGKSAHDRLSVGSDIIAVTGATLSSRAFCRGAKRAAAICEAVYQ